MYLLLFSLWLKEVSALLTNVFGFLKVMSYVPFCSNVGACEGELVIRVFVERRW